MVVALLTLTAREGHLFCESSNLGSFPDVGPGFGLAPDHIRESRLSTGVIPGFWVNLWKQLLFHSLHYVSTFSASEKQEAP